MERFKNDERAQQDLAHTRRLADMKSADFDTIFYRRWPRPDVGSRGQPGLDCADRVFLQLRQTGGRRVPFAGRVSSRDVQGAPIVKGKRVTGFANSEEEAVGLTKVVPFLVEDEAQAPGRVVRAGTHMATPRDRGWSPRDQAKPRPRRRPRRRASEAARAPRDIVDLDRGLPRSRGLGRSAMTSRRAFLQSRLGIRYCS